ncbi:hypothetical protein [Ruminococcus sp.]|uniref:hypothetical protein n=1 Tax=Ruminococcus sp. TaxID=41978 RepID=UPI0025F50678|nr:hypothetical protein [Ruminococcus sp.]
MGTFSVRGDISDVSTFDGRTAYGLQSGQLAFDYLCPAALIGEKLTYHIISDPLTKVNNISLGASVGKGAIIIETSMDGKKWSADKQIITDFWDARPKGQKNIYTTAGNDISKGCYYRVTVSYAIETIIDNSIDSFNYNEIIDFFSTAYHQFDILNPSDMLNKRVTSHHVEQYEFYACTNSGTFSLHNLALKPISIPDQDGYAVDIQQHGETLEDGSVSTVGFKIDLHSSDYTCLVNNRPASDGEEIKTNGRYTVTVRTKLGKEISKTVYVFHPDKKQGHSSYFNESVVWGNRVVDSGDYPCYAYGSELFIKSYNWQTPPIYGRVENKNTGALIDINTRKSSGYRRLLDIGEYTADFYCGKETSGSWTHYQFHFKIVDKEGKPFVNQDLLKNRYEVQDYKAKHYEVTYQTAHGGYIYVCFSKEEDAYNYAYEIEKRFVEKQKDGLYYKEHNNPDKKVKYPVNTKSDRIELTRELVYNAKRNVNPAYINVSEMYTYQTYSGDQDLLDNLEALSLKDSIHVFPSVEEREKLIDRGSDLIEEQVSYLNGFRFVQAGDYDVTEVSAYCKETDEIYPLGFGWRVEDQLQRSGIYTITEKNKYGKTNIYDACLMVDNQTQSKWRYALNDRVTDITVSSESLGESPFYLKADSIQLVQAVNDYDKHVIIKVTKPNGKSITCLLREMQGLILFEKGTYTIEIIDRVKNKQTLNIDVSGKILEQEALQGDAKSLDEISGKVYSLNVHRRER